MSSGVAFRAGGGGTDDGSALEGAAEVRDPHLCCGSAGTYSILQRELAVRLRSVKLATLEEAAPQLIATANIGCLQHLAAAAAVPVKHWIELIDEASTT